MSRKTPKPLPEREGHSLVFTTDSASFESGSYLARWGAAVRACCAAGGWLLLGYRVERAGRAVRVIARLG